MEISGTDTIGSIVSKDIRTANVFRKIGVDFCCGGGVTLEKTCLDNNLSIDEIIAELKDQLKDKQSPGIDFNQMTANMLADYIVLVHHTYADQNIPVIRNYLDKILKVHGDHHPELAQIRELFYEVSGELTAHMKKEEFILFPFIKKLATEPKQAIENSKFGSVESPIAMMMDDHLSEGEKLKQIRVLADNFKCPPDACNTYKLAFQMLHDFESDIHIHMHLENNVLFPKATQLEKEAHEKI